MPNLSLLLRQVMMMVLPLLIIVLLPKVVNTNDPEMRKVSNPYKCYSRSIVHTVSSSFSFWIVLIHSALFCEYILTET